MSLSAPAAMGLADQGADMNCLRLSRLLPIVNCALGLGLLIPGCKMEQADLPTGAGPPTITTTISSATQPPTGTTTLTAPVVVSPPPGSVVSEGRPLLVVANATTSDGTIPTYAFAVASDSTFSTLLARADGVPQEGGGQTSWRVSEMLEPGLYFWQAQARSGASFGPVSAIATFTVRALVAPPPGGVVVSDPLTNGASAGQVNGGRFTQQGWEVTSRDDFIRYEVPSLTSGWVEWDNIGLASRNAAADNQMLFGMWDPTAGNYRTNPFRVHIQKLDTRHNPPYIRLRWIANGEQHDQGHNFMDWVFHHTYHWRMEWGPEPSSNAARVFLDGQPIIQVTYDRLYSPTTHWIELGIGERHESVVGAIYSNVRIGSR